MPSFDSVDDLLGVQLVQVMLEAPPVFAVQIQKPHEVAESERSGFVGLNEPKDFLLLSLR